MRYNNVIKKRDKNKKLHYSPSFVNKIPIKDSDIFIFVNDGDRFDMLAQRYYGDSNLWWIIAKANQMGNGRLGKPEKELLVGKHPTVLSAPLMMEA